MGYDCGDSFPLHLNQMEFHLVQNRKENCHHDHIPCNMKGNGNIVFSVYSMLPEIVTSQVNEKNRQSNVFPFPRTTQHEKKINVLG